MSNRYFKGICINSKSILLKMPSWKIPIILLNKGLRIKSYLCEDTTNVEVTHILIFPS